ncbi:hypothetical protein B0H14DRAFT_2608065 [Mycena olivaceomarginata]|nr:hypothetical protein B0H14DRAFT_2608065 [Mycena olivaceomarginata]
MPEGFSAAFRAIEILPAPDSVVRKSQKMLTEDRDYRKQDKSSLSMLVHHPCSTAHDNEQRMKCSTSTIPLRAHDFVALNAVANLPLSLPFEVSDYMAWQGWYLGRVHYPLRTNVIQYLRSIEQVEVRVEARFEAEQVVKCVDEPESRAPPRN